MKWETHITIIIITLCLVTGGIYLANKHIKDETMIQQLQQYLNPTLQEATIIEAPTLSNGQETHFYDKTISRFNDIICTSQSEFKGEWYPDNSPLKDSKRLRIELQCEDTTNGKVISIEGWGLLPKDATGTFHFNSSTPNFIDFKTLRQGEFKFNYSTTYNNVLRTYTNTSIQLKNITDTIQECTPIYENITTQISTEPQCKYYETIKREFCTSELQNVTEQIETGKDCKDKQIVNERYIKTEENVQLREKQFYNYKPLDKTSVSTLKTDGYFRTEYFLDPDVSSCGTISSAGTYTQTAELAFYGSTCITINADNVIYNGNGYGMGGDSGDSGGTAFLINNRNNITINGAKLYYTTTGVRATNTTNLIINSSNLTSVYNGFLFLNVSNSNISDSIFNSAGDSSILNQSSNNIFKNISLIAGATIGAGQRDYSLKIENSNGNTFINSTIRSISITNSSENTFNRVNVTSRGTGYEDFIIAYSPNATITFIDTTSVTLGTLGNATYPLGKTTFINTTYGEISFLIFNKTNMDFATAIRIGNNSAYSTTDFPANITLYGLTTSYANPVIVRGGDYICPNGECYNYTSLNAGNVIFNVTTWNSKNYTIMERAAALNITGCKTILYAGNYTLGKTINHPNPLYCITYGADNITLNGQGYKITANPFGGGLSFNSKANGIVKNLRVEDPSIAFLVTNGSTLENVYSYDSDPLSMVGGSGLDLQASTNSIISNVTLDYDNWGITLSTNSNNNTIRNLNISRNRGTGIYYISRPSMGKNVFENFTIRNEPAFSSSIGLSASAGGSDTFIANNKSVLQKYFIGAGKMNLTLRNDEYGQIYFFNGMNGTGKNLLTDILIQNNSVWVNTTIAGLNVPANVTLKGLPTFSSPKVMINNTIECSDCYLFSYNSGIAIFNVSSWTGNFSISESTNCWTIAGKILFIPNGCTYQLNTGSSQLI